MLLLTSVIRLLMTMVPNERSATIRELQAEYRTGFVTGEAIEQSFEDLVKEIPLP